MPNNALPPEMDTFYRGLLQRFERNMRDNPRGVYSRAKAHESDTQISMLKLQDMAPLYVTRAVAAKRGWDTSAVGSYVFAVGYSEVGGPDFVPPE